MAQPAAAGAGSSLDARYGRRPPRRVATLRIVGVVVVLALLGWAVWAAFGRSADTVGAVVRSYDVRSPHLVSVTVDITRTTPDPVRCTVVAIATDHTRVGEHVVRLPTGNSGTASVTVAVRTERTATSADVDDCR